MTSNERVLWRVELQNDPCAKCTCIDHADSFAAGRIAGLREAVEAVDKLDICGVCGARMLQLDPCKTIRDECGLYGIYETFLSKYQDALLALEMKP